LTGRHRSRRGAAWRPSRRRLLRWLGHDLGVPGRCHRQRRRRWSAADNTHDA